MKYADQLGAAWKAGWVVRFHAKPTLKPQGDNAHSFGVALVCMYLVGAEVTRNLLIACITHDLGEYWTGDLPSPTKRAMREAGGNFDLDAYEAAQLLEHTGIELPELDNYEKLVLELADALEGLLYCAFEYDLGNRNLLRSAAFWQDKIKVLCQNESVYLDPGLESRVKQLVGYTRRG